MSNELQLFSNNAVPAFAKNNQSALAKALGATLAGGVKRLSIRGGVFRYIVGGTEVAAVEERYLDVVLVNAAPAVSRTYYEGAFVEGQDAVPPSCWSAKGDVPDESVKTPQGPNCAQCPQNVKGSGKDQSKACRYSQRLALVLANDVEGEVLQLSLPATSLFGDGGSGGLSLQEYYKQMNARGIDPTALVTRLKFDTNASTPKVVFIPQAYLTEAQYNTALKQGQTEAAIKAITFTVAQNDGVEKAAPVQMPAGQPPAAAVTKPTAAAETIKKATKAATKKAEEPPAEEVSEPTLRQAPESPAPVNAKLASLVDEWVDD